jgi:hypothetical protein
MRRGRRRTVIAAKQTAGAFVYRIKDWNEHFENNRTRELKRMDWVPMPVKHDGDGYTELVEHPDGAAHFGAWCALVELAAKCDPRGTLVRGDGRPHDSASISRITRLPQAVFDVVIPRLLSLGWLERSSLGDNGGYEADKDEPQEGAGIPQDAAEKRLWNGREWKGTEGKTSCSEPNAASEPEDVDHSAVRFPDFPVIAQRGSPRIWTLSDALVSELAEAFVGVDVRAESRRAHAWIKANPGRRKTAKGMRRFITGWIERSQNRGGRGGASAPHNSGYPDGWEDIRKDTSDPEVQKLIEESAKRAREATA